MPNINFTVFSGSDVANVNRFRQAHFSVSK